MSTCWWCHWGLPTPIQDVYDKALKALDGHDSALKFGPAHIVWEDHNWDSAQWCLDNRESWISNDDEPRYSDKVLNIVRQSLVELIAVPDEFKHEPDGFDGENPDQFPPPKHWEILSCPRSPWGELSIDFEALQVAVDVFRSYSRDSTFKISVRQCWVMLPEVNNYPELNEADTQRLYDAGWFFDNPHYAWSRYLTDRPSQI